MKGKLRKFSDLPWKEKMLLAEALLFQLIAGLLLRIFPFRKIPSMFPDTKHPIHNNEFQILAQVKSAIMRAGQFSMWRNKCLVHSLAARWMLARRGVSTQLYLGVTHDRNKKPIAHAWLKAADYEIIEKNGDYGELLKF